MLARQLELCLGFGGVRAKALQNHYAVSSRQLSLVLSGSPAGLSGSVWFFLVLSGSVWFSSGPVKQAKAGAERL